MYYDYDDISPVHITQSYASLQTEVRHHLLQSIASEHFPQVFNLVNYDLDIAF